jgi:CheY-like chemotaxis protein
VASSPELAVWILDLESRTVGCSNAVAAMVGSAFATPTEWVACVVDADRERFAAALESGMPFDLEVTFTPPGARDVRVRASRIERLLVGTCEVGDGPATIARVVRNLTHDLNNPLAAAMANLELIRDSLGADSQVDDMVDDAQQALRRMRAIIAGLRGMTRAERPRPSSREPEPAAKSLSRVLVVDDEVLFTNVVYRVLRHDHQLTICNHTDDAIARFEAGERFDAIVCDLMMPRIGGMGLYTRVAELAPEQAGRFIFVTAGTTTAAAQAFLSGRANPRLEKPCDFKELRALVARVASEKPAP